MNKTIILSSICLLLSAAAYAETRSLTAVPTTDNMVIDGELTEAAWNSTPPSPSLLDRDTGQPVPSDHNTTFRVLYDRTGVYVGIRANEPNADMLGGINNTDLDAVSWLHDELEVFFDTQGDRQTYYRFAINLGTARADHYFTEGGKTIDGGWNPDWKAATYIGKDFYSAEFYIPFAALHRQVLCPGKQDWVFSIARQRIDATQHKLSVLHPTSERLVARYDATRMLKHQFSFFNQPTAGKEHHDPPSWGWLHGIEVPPETFVVSAGEPTVTVEKVDEGYQAIFSLDVVNHGQVAQTLDLTATLKDDERVTNTITLAGGESRTIPLPPLAVDVMGEVYVRFAMTDAESGDQRYANTTIFLLAYRPIDIVMRRPAYRNTIYFSQTIDEIQGEIVLDLPAARLQGAELSVALRDHDRVVHATLRIPVDRETAPVPLTLPVTDLPVGDYQLQVVLRDATGETVAEASETLSKAGPPPGIEARIDRHGVFRLNGTPLFLRGFTGRTGYIVPSVAMAKVGLPRAVNFVSGGELGLRYGTYGIVNFSGSLVLERLAQQNKPLTDELKEELLRKIRWVKYDMNTIGYQIADEPESRNMSPDALREVYELVKREDPYRVGIIISRTADTYVDACDVIASHPNMGPQLRKGGRRLFKQDFDYTHRIMDAGYRAVNGRAKALWCMPQIFSYYPRDPFGVQPTFEEARWQIWSGVANHAMGIWSSMFSYYWNNYESRIGVTAVYETLAMIEIPWIEDSEDIPVTVSTDNDGALDVLARRHAPPDRPDHVYMVAVNRSGEPTTASISFDGMEKFKRLYVLRENRTIDLTEQGFVDAFDTLGAHVYTTSDVLPLMKSLANIQADIDALKNAYDPDNLLRNGSTDWQRGGGGRNARLYGDGLADGLLDGAGWFDWFAKRATVSDSKELLLVFPQGVAFKELVFHSNNIKEARLEVWNDGKWTELAHWEDIYTEATAWKGDTVQAGKLRITVDQIRDGHRDWTWGIPCIMEIEMY